MNSVYMDNNANTSLKKEVLNAMMPYYTDIYGNASSKFYKIGRDAEQALYKLRESVAKSLNAKNVNEIYFTGSGCEADNQGNCGNCKETQSYFPYGRSTGYRTYEDRFAGFRR